jgi:hypothetical protein
MRAVGVKSYSATVWKSRLSLSRSLPRLAVSHGVGEADQVAQPPPWRFQDSGQTKHYSRLDDHALVVRPACNPLRCYHLVSPSPSSPAASTPQNLTSGRRLSRRAPKFLILEVIGLERAEPILITASRSQDVIRSARRDPARVSFPRGCRGSSLTLRAGIRPPSTQPPPALLPVSRSARGRLAACGPAQQS